MKAKVIIIGGGVSGLSAGIYALQNGYGVEILEKNHTCGGMCIGWRRNNHLIDNCVHWLTGTNPNNKLYNIWKNVGVLGENVELIKPEYFYASVLDGQTLHLWRDLDRTEQEMLAISPEDKKEIKKFIKYTRIAQKMQIPTDKPFDLLNGWEFTKLGLSMLNISRVARVYGNMTVTELAMRFKHPLIQCLIKDCISNNYLAYSFLVAYGTFISGNGDIPKGGSIKMIERMVKRFENLGGKISTDVDVKQIVINKEDHNYERAIGVELSNHEFIPADYVIATCDVEYTFTHLLDSKYMGKKLQKTYLENDEQNPIGSSFHVALSLEGTFKEIPHYTYIDCQPLTVGTQEFKRFSVKNYTQYDNEMAPLGKTIIQASFNQKDDDYQYWTKLYQNKDQYLDVKKYLATETLKRIEDKYPQYKGQITVLDEWTPITYQRYCNAYKGSYMGFVGKKNIFKRIFSGKIKKLPNVFLASQWLMAPGGLPIALLMGKFATEYINNDYKNS